MQRLLPCHPADQVTQMFAGLTLEKAGLIFTGTARPRGALLCHLARGRAVGPPASPQSPAGQFKTVLTFLRRGYWY